MFASQRGYMYSRERGLVKIVIINLNSFLEISCNVVVDYVVKYRQDDLTIAKPSSVIKWNKGSVIVIRP